MSTRRCPLQPRYPGASASPGLGAENADAQRALARIQALAALFFKDVAEVGRRDHDDVRTEIIDQLHLLLGLAARHGDDGAAQALCAVVRAQPAREQAVAIGHVDDVARLAARGADGARHQVGPVVQVARGIADHGGLAGRAAGGMDARYALARHGEHAEGVVVAQVFLARERKLGDVGELLEIVRVHARLVEGLFIVRHILVGVADSPFQPFELQGLQFVAAGVFDRIQPRLAEGSGHGVSLLNILRGPVGPPSQLKNLGLKPRRRRRSALLFDRNGRGKRPHCVLPGWSR